MNTEALNTLKIIRETRVELISELNGDLEANERDLIEEAVSNLTGQENALIIDVLKTSIDTLNTMNEELKDLIERMEGANAHLEAISKRVKSVSEVVGTLVEITTKAMSAGLI
jgi:hypothetical protein